MVSWIKSWFRRARTEVSQDSRPDKGTQDEILAKAEQESAYFYQQLNKQGFFMCRACCFNTDRTEITWPVMFMQKTVGNMQNCFPAIIAPVDGKDGESTIINYYKSAPSGSSRQPLTGSLPLDVFFERIVDQKMSVQDAFKGESPLRDDVTSGQTFCWGNLSKNNLN